MEEPQIDFIYSYLIDISVVISHGQHQAQGSQRDFKREDNKCSALVKRNRPRGCPSARCIARLTREKPQKLPGFERTDEGARTTRFSQRNENTQSINPYQFPTISLSLRFARSIVVTFPPRNGNNYPVRERGGNFTPMMKRARLHTIGNILISGSTNYY